MSDKWHEMLDHLVNKNEDQAKEAFKTIIDNEKETFIAQDAVEPEVTESLTPADEKAVKNVIKNRTWEPWLRVSGFLIACPTGNDNRNDVDDQG